MDFDAPFSAARFFEDVPEEDDLPYPIEIPGPIPDLVDLYSLNVENNESRVSVIPEDHEDVLPAVNSIIPGPIPADFVDLYVQKQETCSEPNSKSRIAKKSPRSCARLVPNRTTRAREKISKEKLKKAVSKELQPKSSCPKGRRRTTKVAKTTCGERLLGNRKKPAWSNATLMILR